MTRRPLITLGNPNLWQIPASWKKQRPAGWGAGEVFESLWVNVSDMGGETTEERFVNAINAAPHVVVDIYVTITGDVVVPETVTLDFMGGYIRIDGTLWIQGAVVAPHNEIFTVPLPASKGTETLKFFSTRQPSPSPKINEHMGEVSAAWFNSPTDDWGERINKAIRCGGNDTIIRLPATYGDWSAQQFGMVRTTIDFDQDRWYSHQTLRGSSHIGSSLCIDKNLAIVGIDASNSRELMLDRIRLIEASGVRKSCCCAGGGTTLRIVNCWFANSKYGYIQNKGAGTDINGLTVEGCEHGVYISGSLDDPSIANFPAYNSVRRVVIRGLLVFGCFETGVSLIRGNAYGLDGVALVGGTVHYQDVTPLHIDDSHDGTAIFSFTSCYLRDVPLSIVGGGTVQWVASMVKDEASPNGRETLLP